MDHRPPNANAQPRPVARFLARLRDDRGFGLIELTVATSLLAVAVMGVAGAMSLGMVTTAQARQRSVASALAAERVERARNLPYEGVALDAQPSHSTDPTHPDHRVTQETPPRYNVDQTGAVLEPLVVGGNVRHVEDPVRRGQTELYAYQYVTWVNDPNIDGTTNYKRLTVVVTWRNEMVSGPTPRIVVSTFIFPTSLPLEDAAPEQAPDGASAAGVLTEVQSCAGDDEAPTGFHEITSGTGANPRYTNSTTLQVRLQAQDDCPEIYADLSNDGSTFTPIAAPSPGVPTTIAWTIPTGDGTKTIHARFRDGAGNTSEPAEASVVLDQTEPTDPAGFARVTCSMSANNRTVLFTWSPSQDANLSGYRMFRRVNAEHWQVIVTTSVLQAEDTTRKSFDSVRYMVRAYDKAGNESGESNVLSFARNSC